LHGSLRATGLASTRADQVAGSPIDVAVGILMQANGDVLLACRPEGKPYAGYWEFPGGKVEPGESVLAALIREFAEEIDVHIETAEAWCCVEHVYPHAHVRLHFFISRAWRGQPRSLEGQALAWQGAAFAVEPILPATVPLLEWLDKVRFGIGEGSASNDAESPHASG
jgi:8-oxo-dGTP diphosphatase